MIDLHSHTTCSDGEMDPEKLIDLAISKNIKVLAITDHDGIDGLDNAIYYAKEKTITLIPGIELEATVPKGKMHILGLFIDYKNKEFNTWLANIRDERNKRNDNFIKELNKMGFKITIDELKEFSSGNSIGKPHFAKLFLKKNYIQTKSEMFDKYFNQPPLNKYKKSEIEPKEVIQMIKKINGIAILAHPQTLKLDDSELILKLKELKSYGLDGIECYHSNQTKEQMENYKQIAKKLGLIISKGSDYHGPIIKPEISLGTGINNNIVSDEEDYIFNTILNYKQKNS